MYGNLENSEKKTGLLIFRIFSLIVRCSKYDFWNLWEILDRHRCSEKSFKHMFSKKSRFFGGIPKFYRHLDDSLITRYKEIIEIPIEFCNFHKKSTKNSEKTSTFFFAGKISISKKIFKKKSEHLCRCGIFQRFQKSYFKNR